MTKSLSPDKIHAQISKLCLDAFSVDVLLIAPPYTNLSRVDHGMRNMMWENYQIETDSLQFIPLVEDSTSHQIYLIKSTLGFYNMFAPIDMGDMPIVLSFGPFKDHDSSLVFFSQLEKLGLDVDTTQELREIYQNFPVVDLSRFTAFTRDLLAMHISEYADSEVNYINFDEKNSNRRLNPNRLIVEEISSDVLELQRETIIRFNKALKNGEANTCNECLNSLYSKFEGDRTESIVTLKKFLNILNSFCLNGLIETTTNFPKVYRCYSNFDEQIEALISIDSLKNCAYDLVRKYCMLAHNYSGNDYSYLTKQIMRYISTNMSEPVSLDDIADHFKRNPSYISRKFKEDTGETLTNYIKKEKVAAAIELLNITTLSLHEISDSVGIPDYSYFSKLFKSVVGSSPKQYMSKIRG